MPLFPPPEEKKKGSTVYLPESMWEELKEIAEVESGTEKKRTISDVCEHFLRWAIADYREKKAEQGDALASTTPEPHEAPRRGRSKK
ncbi:hypothetical protein [Corallococcus sp. AS-1-6]|uniref:hypothetical protein n=1 Tax=Corallococcus sp. AS-1-6 TaxID=2874599 RepID=UPI001CC14237|nr:hypothetical protein [Corallococcus sp. AS-1-6]MBZ4373197.1 hypothetical protein [Corallococcus sp. AS-1-6]